MTRELQKQIIANRIRNPFKKALKVCCFFSSKVDGITDRQVNECTDAEILAASDLIVVCQKYKTGWSLLWFWASLFNFVALFLDWLSVVVLSLYSFFLIYIFTPFGGDAYFSRNTRPRIPTKFSRNTRPNHAFPRISREKTTPAIHSHVILAKYAPPPCVPTYLSRNTCSRHAFPVSGLFGVSRWGYRISPSIRMYKRKICQNKG